MRRRRGNESERKNTLSLTAHELTDTLTENAKRPLYDGCPIMEKTTVLARLRLTLDFNEAARNWMGQLHQAWFTRNQGVDFLSEYGSNWEAIFLHVAEQEIRTYFANLGMPKEYLPFVRTGEKYQGSWIIEAAVLMAASVGGAYAILKSVSELPKIAEGLTDLKGRISDYLKPSLNEKVKAQLTQTIAAGNVSAPTLEKAPPPPRDVLNVGFMIDARPVLSLTPALLKAHKLHLSVAISRESFTLENLGDEALQDIRLGLFRTKTQRNQWSYQDAYVGQVSMLSSHQTLAKRLGEFRDGNGNLLDMSDGEPAYVDCWVQDIHGIYILQFYLERE